MSVERGVSPGHPRAESIRIREKLTGQVETGVVALAGLIAHGRGEAFDYLIGERTIQSAERAVTAAAAALLLAEHAVISVNGNLAALCPKDTVDLYVVTGAMLEVNLFHRLPGRDEAIKRRLVEAGAITVYGVGEDASARLDEINSERRRVDPRGILAADTVLVPLEDGDRTEALRRMGKTVITIDLNPLSRTARAASITIVDNIVRAMPLLVSETRRMKGFSRDELMRTVSGFSNGRALSDALCSIRRRLKEMEEKGVIVELSERAAN